MSFYELLLLVHIVGAIVWLGAGLLLQLQALRADRAQDADGLKRVVDDSAALSLTLFVPASSVVFIAGVLLVVDGPWGLENLWVAIGLAGYLATFLTGVLVMKPRSERIAALMAEEGMSPRATTEIRKLLALGRADAIALYLVVAVMALKPTGEDPAVLGAMALVVVAGVVWALQRVRAIDAEAARTAPAAAVA
jgi:uncharacterized membrane protein